MSTTNWPRTDAEITFSGAFTCTHHNDAERTACPVCLVAALTAECDQLRAENIAFRAAQKACEACDEPTAFEVRQFRAEMERLRSDRDCEKRLRKDADEFRENAIARAERAEAEIIRLRTENSDLKATDTRPLLTGTLTHAGFCRIGEEQLDGVFISIDREQIKALRHLPMYQQIELRVAAITEGAK